MVAGALIHGAVTHPDMGIYCASCHDGPYKRDFIEDGIENGSYDENIIYGYWFCEWCRQYTDEPELIARAHNKNARQPFPDKQTA